MRRLYKCVIILSFLGFAGAVAGCNGMPPVHLQLGGLQGGDDVPITPRPSRDIQVFTSDREAAAVAREVLLTQGRAADAAVALAITLTVTQPSAAGLGGGGVCILRDAAGDLTGISFPAPALVRGLTALHAKFGAHPWSSLVVSAETLARFGHPVSTALADNLTVHGGALVADSVALAAFMNAERRMIGAGEEWRQPRLSDTLARVRGRGFFSGNAPTWFTPDRDTRTVSLDDATTGFAVGDRDGSAVGCALTMGRPFGLGMMARDGGYLFAAAAPADQALDQIALSLLACVGDAGRADPCPMPAATFSLK